MRISDLSSDVCSSDLPARGLRRSTRANLHSKVARPHQNTTLPLPVKHHCGHPQSARLTPRHALRLIGKEFGEVHPIASDLLPEHVDCPETTKVKARVSTVRYGHG